MYVSIVTNVIFHNDKVTLMSFSVTYLEVISNFVQFVVTSSLWRATSLSYWRQSRETVKT